MQLCVAHVGVLVVYSKGKAFRVAAVWGPLAVPAVGKYLRLVFSAPAGLG